MTHALRHRAAAALPGLALAASLVVRPPPAGATARHNICDDLRGNLGFGVSSFSAAGTWPQDAHATYGVDWRFLYVYLVPSGDPVAAQQSYLRDKISTARAMGAIPVLTFYHLLQMGQAAGLTGTEPEVVRQTLQNAAVMRAYFDRVVFVLQTVRDQGSVLLQVEPDSWGFMMWAFGVEGNADATSVPVRVAASGHPDLAGLPDHAGGFGRALLALRDRYAPDVRMGWHASNFRAGARPEVAAGFYGAMGEWDVLTSEEPHNEADPTMWWLPWDAARLQTNLDWFAGLTRAAHVPVLLWQLSIGTTDFHLLGADGSERATLTRYAQAGVAGLMMDMRGSGDPSLFRAHEDPRLATVPPASTGAGGTAADMRTRLAVYSRTPLAWPAGSPCFAASSGDAGVGADGGGGATDGGTSADGAPTADGSGTEGGVRADGGTVNAPGGCGCRASRGDGGSRAAGLALALALGLRARRRRRAG